jgi:2-polyprenyl-6-methoxyphenol hydroxylase-like FAD-dependent oxidoreductase
MTLTGALQSSARRLPVVIAGAGPAGTATAIGLERAGEAVLVFEARGSVATRARNVFLRPQARDIFEDLVGHDPGRDTTIMSIENSLRGAARDAGVPIAYDERVVDLVEHANHITVKVQRAGSDEVRSIDARMFVDATGARLAATNTGELERVATGVPHVYVTAQYGTPVSFKGVHGAFDRARSETMLLYPVEDGKGFITYYDLPPGVAASDEAAILARYDALAGQLQLGTPLTPPQLFDAQQHLSRSAASGHVLKIGDSAGNADPYIGAGVAAALVDAVTATRVLTSPGDPVLLARAAADDVLAGHRNLASQASKMIRARPIAMRLLPDASFDETLRPADLGRSRILDAVAAILTTRPIHAGS